MQGLQVLHITRTQCYILWIYLIQQLNNKLLYQLLNCN